MGRSLGISRLDGMVVEFGTARRVASGAKQNVTPSTSFRNHRHIDGHTKVIAARADKTATHRNRLADIAANGNAYQTAAVDRPIHRDRSKGTLRLRGGSTVTLCSKLPVDEIGGFVRGILGG